MMSNVLAPFRYFLFVSSCPIVLSGDQCIDSIIQCLLEMALQISALALRSVIYTLFSCVSSPVFLMMADVSMIIAVIEYPHLSWSATTSLPSYVVQVLDSVDGHLPQQPEFSKGCRLLCDAGYDPLHLGRIDVVLNPAKCWL